MKIQRGRPKNVVVDGEEKVSPAVTYPKGTIGINRIYKYKDGSVCTVTYSGCKVPPIITIVNK